MSGGGRDAFGTLFQREVTAGVFETIANLTDINAPERTREALEVTNHGSPDQHRQFIKGLMDGGEADCTLNYDPGEATQVALRSDFEEKDFRKYRLVFLPGDVDEETWTVSAMITKLGVAAPHDNILEQEITIKTSGKPVIT
ncbi:phage tail tube protein [Glycomyces paridis]|uniref:Lambda phage tail tube protein N-terminal domain-containing protein n=1 Tax=Glycomyces paridis TaxID=2126555 RepID=A0A4S8PF50_9ACTN|nr:phage tail tube protein [Glycomyces paridis]THV27942.1 hypothetical protein E9998_13205 [Glycomyces paridis]